MRSLSSPDADILAVKTTYSGGYADGAAFGPRDDSYDERDFWEGQGFDFAGGTLPNRNETWYEFTGIERQRMEQESLQQVGYGLQPWHSRQPAAPSKRRLISRVPAA